MGNNFEIADHLSFEANDIQPSISKIFIKQTNFRRPEEMMKASWESYACNYIKILLQNFAF